jgi:hypothetical protein
MGSSAMKNLKNYLQNFTGSNEVQKLEKFSIFGLKSKKFQF